MKACPEPVEGMRDEVLISNPLKQISVFVGAVPPWLPHTNRGSHGGTTPTGFMKQLRGFEMKTQNLKFKTQNFIACESSPLTP